MDECIKGLFKKKEQRVLAQNERSIMISNSSIRMLATIKQIFHFSPLYNLFYCVPIIIDKKLPERNMKLAASQELKEGLETKHVNDGLLGYLVSRFSLDSLSRKLNRNPVLEQDNILRVKQISSSSLRTKISIDVAEPRND